MFRSSDHAYTDLASPTEHEILQIRERSIRYCSQLLQVIPRVPAVEVVAESLIRTGTPRAEATELAEDLLAKLRLPRELWDAYPATFSGGEQQRINMARALISRSQLLLVDEPTASLDAGSKEIVLNMLLDMKRSGSSVVLISHDEATLSRLADRRLHLHDGHVAAQPVLQ
jgi:alpha-D-ribose 1-methylphosphonate 5-triphosphate synthase subunit PhnL